MAKVNASERYDILLSAVHNVRLMRAACDDAAVACGIRWYVRTATYCRLWASRLQATGHPNVTPLHVAGVLSALSSNTSWKYNLAFASRLLHEYSGHPIACASATCAHRGTLSCPKGGLHTLGNNVDKARRIITTAITEDDIDSILSSGDAQKTRDFTRATSGTDYGVAVCDRHAYRIATAYADCPSPFEYGKGKCGGAKGHGCGKVPEGEEYAVYSEAYKVVAAEYNEAPSFTQAVTWIMTRRLHGWVK